MKVFVVDRDEDSGKVLELLKLAPGVEASAARTGDEALEKTQSGEIDLLITEVFIEPMNGFTLRNKMENRHPGVRTIFLTGYDLAPYAEHTQGHEILTKPVTAEMLFPAIARATGVNVTPAAPPEELATQTPVPSEEIAQAPRVAVPRVVATPRAVPTANAVAVPRAVPAAATPVAVPRAVPAAATPVAVPRAVPAAATPVAVPRAVPAAATPVAVPRAVPTAATPVAVPRAVPAAATPVAMPRAVPAAATPVAVPRAVPVAATPVAVPRAVPSAATPVAQATPVGTPVAVPRATPAATPVAVPQAAPAAAQAAVPHSAPAAATPLAVPRAVHAATPAAVPQATPVAAPAPVLKAAPIAVPRAAPAAVAVPRATPAAAPVTSPQATPVAAPVAVPRAMPAANPGSQPAPAVVPSARPVAVPKAAPAAVAVPMATPVAVPKAQPVAVPRAAPAPVAVPRATAAPTTSPAATVQARPAVAAAPDPLIGKTLGAYRIERRLGKGKWGPVYYAIQVSMNRPVAMELLAAESASDSAARENFVATARAKATVQHPHILSVYEADTAEGWYFYTHEYVDGLTLSQLVARGEGLSEPTALQTIKCVAQALSYLHQHKTAHSIPDDSDIYIGSDGLPYLSNVALPTEEMPATQEEICTLGRIVRTVLPGGRAENAGLQAMLSRMAMTTQAGYQSWQALFQAIQAIEPRVIPADAFKLSAQDEAAIRAVEAARKRQKLVIAGSIAGLVVFLVLLLGLVWWQFFRPEVHDYSDVMVRIEGGSFLYQDGQTRTLPTFYIDKYEVTMAEYEKFLDFLKAHGNPTDYDSELQPAGRSHVPKDWDIFYGRASSGIPAYRTVRNVPISPDCPVFNVDYFDAYAYAKWKGRRLPTQEEWEKAARGPSGNLYPWGNAWDPTKLNAGGDYQAAPQPGYKPGVDGFTWWAPVDAFPGDRSPFGVMGMGGNVSEWTGSWDPSKTYVMIRGGNFKSTSEQALTTSIIKAYPQEAIESLGFRTAGDNPPSGGSR